MRRVREQCAAQRSTEAIAQPAARRPEAQRGTRPKLKIKILPFLHKKKEYPLKSMHLLR
ncbi:MAG: hypothetical protein NZ455_12295 [Bacteroidia bacterium]|nr:hypothetical protein [Bacteroidia bacterium]MDW8346083.1 hypothetical protein [Bacteroidia bacterium]